jgi:hypothetical protein
MVTGFGTMVAMIPHPAWCLSAGNRPNISMYIVPVTEVPSQEHRSHSVLVIDVSLPH